ncbi:MAG: hypothetical protein PHI63_05620 [Patescibacteria group bacterium]|nr:hypothetical protein [Patescibacteria group bacterium]
MTFRRLLQMVRDQLQKEAPLFDAALPGLLRAVGKTKLCPPNWLDFEVAWDIANICYGCAIPTFLRVAAERATSPDDLMHQQVKTIVDALRRLLEEECEAKFESIAITTLAQMEQAARLAKVLGDVDITLLLKLDAAGTAFLDSLDPTKPPPKPDP